MQCTKDRLPTDQIPGTIYALECTDCSSVYIGETERTAKQRSKEHQMHTRTGHTELSAVANHAHKYGHSVQWTPKILARALGQSVLTLGLELHMYTCMHAFATLTASHHMVKVHDVNTKHLS